MPLRDLADGYKSTFFWIIDMFGWALNFNKQTSSGEDIYGIVLIDEIEQHLHPKWQGKFVQLLRQSFPNIQFVVTTHSPIIASNTLSIDSQYEEQTSNLVYLELTENNNVVKNYIPSLQGLDYDQVLADKSFDYLISINPKVDKILRAASMLASKGEKRDNSEEIKYNKVKNILKKIYRTSGKSLAERIAQKEVDDELKLDISKLERCLFKDNTK